MNEYDDEQSDDYLRSMVNTAISFGANSSRAMEEMNDTFEFLKRLANVSFNVKINERKINFINS